MRRFALMSVAASLAIGAVASASAADLPAQMPAKAPVTMMPVYNWNGLYIGAQIGYQWGRNTEDEFVTATGVPTATANWNSDGVVGGIHVGYNWVIAPNWLIGVEGDIEGSGVEGSYRVAGGGTEFSQDWQASIRGRLGYFTGPALFYVTGGAAFSELKTRHFNAAGITLPGDSFASTETGWTVGGGVEWMFAPSWTARAEYRYTDFGNFGTDVAPTSFPAFSYDQDVHFHTVRLGLTHLFNFGR
jgi:outer membrane immunogenic protein